MVFPTLALMNKIWIESEKTYFYYMNFRERKKKDRYILHTRY